MTKPPERPAKGKAQFPTESADERRLQVFLARERKARGVTLSRAQAFALLFRRGLDVEGVRA